MASKWVVLAGLQLKRGSKGWKWVKQVLLKWHPKNPKPKPKPAPIVAVMYDDVNVGLIPKDAPAVAGYIGGRWPTYDKVVKGWPKAKHLSIAVSSIYDADCLDVEPGDATVAQAAAWVKRQRGLRKQGKVYNTSKPVVYTSASWGQGLVNALSKAGLVYGEDYLWWSAHYNPAQGKHICGPKCGFGLKVTAHGTQWTDHSHNESLDESVLTARFFA